MKVLVLAAHPDDEVLGCGGTMARLAKEGHEVYIAIFGEGITSRFTERTQADPEEIKQLHAKSQGVADLVGAKELFMYSLPDNRFDSMDILDVVKPIEQLVDRLRPEVVYTQHGGDLNIDHVVLYRATMTATRPMQGCPVKELYAYEVASSSEWAFQKFSPAFRPDTFVEITDYLELKIKAMEHYESEARPYPHPRSPDALRAQAMRWGSAVGVGAAEAFELVRAVH